MYCTVLLVWFGAARMFVLFLLIVPLAPLTLCTALYCFCTAEDDELDAVEADRKVQQRVSAAANRTLAVTALVKLLCAPRALLPENHHRLMCHFLTLVSPAHR